MKWARGERRRFNLASPDRAALVQAMDEVKRALEIAGADSVRFWCNTWGCPMRVSARRNRIADDSIEHLRPSAKPLGVRLLLENIPMNFPLPID